MRILPSDLSAEFQKEILRYFFMVEFVLTATYRFNDTEEKLYSTGGDLYLPRSFVIDNISSSSGGSVSELDIEVDNTDQQMGAIVLAEDVRNKVVHIHMGVVAQTNFTGVTWMPGMEWQSGMMWSPDGTATEIITQEVLRGVIASWELSADNRIRFTVKNELVLWSKRSLRLQTSSCPWSFKGIECAYAGSETWCDQSYDRCVELNNNYSFGGHRFLPDTMERNPTWGKGYHHSHDF